MPVAAAKSSYMQRQEGFLSTFRDILNGMFVEPDHEVNAHFVMQKLKEREIDIEQFEEFINSLPEGEWTMHTYVNNIDEINELFGINDDVIRETAVTELTQDDVEKIRWRVLVDSMLEYSKFANEFFDALKYNKSSEISGGKLDLLDEMMLTFKRIKNESKKLYDHFKNQDYTETNMKRFNLARLGIEFLFLRIIYIAYKLKEADDQEMRMYSEYLAKERLSISTHKVYENL